MANPYGPKTKNDDNKSMVSNIGGAASSPTPVTDAMNMESLRKPAQVLEEGNQSLKMYGGGMVKKYAMGGGTRPVRR
jgi:hypothetical protein|tara:strand:- start:598 stop:828 length:231 start_codon:yes stop_codon:yes gene_type:complete